MGMDPYNRLKTDVMDRGLCVSCGACAGLCPHFGWHQDRVAALHACERESGCCEEVCPRTACDPQALFLGLTPPETLTREMGPVRKLWMTQACESAIKSLSQHGGTVTALACYALEQGVVDGWIMARSDGMLGGIPALCRTKTEVVACAGTKLTSVPILAGFLEAASMEAGKLGVVATPCQSLALARIRASEHPRLHQAAQSLTLVIGLFCGWIFDARGLSKSLSGTLDLASIKKMDIPPSQYQALEATTNEQTHRVSLSEVSGSVRSACSYCFDFTAEFADVSVGSARLPSGWEEAKHWNQTVIRTQEGANLVKQAGKAGVIDLREPPEGSLEKLKAVAYRKKQTACRNLCNLSGNPDDLLYLPAGFIRETSSS